MERSFIITFMNFYHEPRAYKITQAFPTHLLCVKRWLNFSGASVTSRHTKNTRMFTEDASRSYGKVRQPFRLLSRSTLRIKDML